MLLVLNKIDLARVQNALPQTEEIWRKMTSWETVFKISAQNGQGIAPLTQKLLSLLPLSPPFFPKDQASDRFERFFAAEIIREKIFELYGEEVPHACAVEISDYQEIPGRMDQISATLYVERESQKPIILGKQGRAIRRLREKASPEIAAFVGRPITLSLWVKVRKNWRQDNNALRDLGYF
jgi:GTP-binding protein Era